MGNTVSAADLAASQILYPNTPSYHYKHKKDYNYGGEIPEECPMHQKHKIVKDSECPVNHGQDEINPLNMVSYLSIVYNRSFGLQYN